MSRWVQNKPTNWSRFKAGEYSAMIYMDHSRNMWSYDATNYKEKGGQGGHCATLEEAKAICDSVMKCEPDTQKDLFA